MVGMLAVKALDSVLDQIFVAPDAQGTGVGRALLQVAKSVMPAGFTLRMSASNGRARHFYESQGLRLIAEGIHPWSGLPVQFFGWKIQQLD